MRNGGVVDVLPQRQCHEGLHLVLDALKDCIPLRTRTCVLHEPACVTSELRRLLFGSGFLFPTTSLVTLADAEHHEYVRPEAFDTRRSTPGEAEAGANEPKLWPMPITNLEM